MGWWSHPRRESQGLAFIILINSRYRYIKRKWEQFSIHYCWISQSVVLLFIVEQRTSTYRVGEDAGREGAIILFFGKEFHGAISVINSFC